MLVNKRVYDRITILVLLTLIVSSLSITHVSAYEIGVYTFCKDVDKSAENYKPIHPTNVFEDTDKQVYFMIVFHKIEKPYQIIVKWIQPNGTLATTTQETFDDPKNESYEYWSYYNWAARLDFQKPPTPGQWKLELYIDNKLELSEGFEIRSTAPTPTPTQTITVTATTTITPATQEIQKTKTDTGYLNLLYLTIAILTSALAALGLRLVKKRKISPQEQNVARTRAISPQEQNVTIYCSYCGKANRPDVSYCTSCGKSINE